MLVETPSISSAACFVVAGYGLALGSCEPIVPLKSSFICSSVIGGGTAGTDTFSDILPGAIVGSSFLSAGGL